MELKFAVDTKHRKGWFTGMSFSHPAKMSLPLQLWIIENYTKVGDVILDPMAGSGTILIACSMGRNVIAVELESKFIDMMHGNWEKIKQRGAQMGYSMGTAQIIRGDARQLSNILCDKIITSPPYAESLDRDEHKVQAGRVQAMMDYSYTDRKHGKSEGQIARLPYGNIDKIITSPPYAESIQQSFDADKAKRRLEKLGLDSGSGHFTGQVRRGTGGQNVAAGAQGYSDDLNNIGNLSYGDIDAVIKPEVNHIITSPPYEASLEKNKEAFEVMRLVGGASRAKRMRHNQPQEYQDIDKTYSQSNNNIGNLKSQSYLEAMLAVYRQCFAVLRDGGLMILVVKPFIRDQKLVPLQEDTKRLCKQAGFIFVDEHHRILPSQSFWRIIYAQRFPNAPKIDREYVLIFRKEVNND